MPHKAFMDPETWMHHFKNSDLAAKYGEYLPTLEELYCGMSFYNHSVDADAREWSKRIIPHLAEKGQRIPRNQVQFALERLTVSAQLEDLKFVYDAILTYSAPPEMLAAVLCALRRLVIYRVFSGDESMRLILVDDLIHRIHWLTCESTGLGQRIR